MEDFQRYNLPITLSLTTHRPTRIYRSVQQTTRSDNVLIRFSATIWLYFLKLIMARKMVTIVVYLLFLSLSKVSGFADWMTKDFCSRELAVGAVIMNNRVVASDDRLVRVFRGTKGGWHIFAMLYFQRLQF